MHSRDATVLIDLLWFNVVHYTPACFSTFFKLYTMVPTLANFLVYLFVNLKNNIMIMIIILVEGGTASWTL